MDARKAILTRRARFVAAALAAAGIAVIDESMSHGAGAGAGDAGAPSTSTTFGRPTQVSDSLRSSTNTDGGATTTTNANDASAARSDTSVIAKTATFDELMKTVRELRLSGDLVEALAILDEVMVNEDAGVPSRVSGSKKPRTKTEAQIKRDAEEWKAIDDFYRELRAATPTIIVLTRDGAGIDRPWPVEIDGQSLGAQRDGGPANEQRINPGQHVIRATNLDTGARKEEQFIVREGEKKKLIVVVMSEQPCLQPWVCLSQEPPKTEKPTSHGCSCDVPGARKR